MKTLSRPLVGLLTVSMAVVLAACQSWQSPPEPDVIVNLERSCWALVNGKRIDVTPSFCEDYWKSGPDLAVALEVHLTIRTPQGTTYRIMVPWDTQVAIGDPWPPQGTGK